MCLKIPLQVTKVDGSNIFTENGRQLVNKTNSNIKVGNYVFAFGNIVVSVLSRQQGYNIRRKIKDLIK